MADRQQIWNAIWDKLFAGQPRMPVPPGVPLTTTAGVPTHTAALGTLNYDSTNDDVYYDADGAADWNKVNA
jgi:hypothetical protein